MASTGAENTVTDGRERRVLNLQGVYRRFPLPLDRFDRDPTNRTWNLYGLLFTRPDGDAPRYQRPQPFDEVGSLPGATVSAARICPFAL
jgi:hypothetical protein